MSRSVSSLWLLILSGLAGFLGAEDGVVSKRPPNIVLIISDDQAWTDYSFMGHSVVQTPSLDRLAAESALFPRAYVTTSLCRPSLATMITGLYPHQHRITGNDPAIPPGKSGSRKNPEYLAICEDLISNIEKVPTLPRLLRQEGYVSYQSGKWWEGSHTRGGFTHGMTHGDPARGGRHGDDGLEVGRRGLRPVTEFIKSSGERPFFLWYAPFLPHTPHNPPERLLMKYRQDGRPLRLAKYYAMCEWFDETCGELIGFLDRTGRSEDTLIIYLADNGWIQRTPETVVPQGWNQGFAPRSKQSPYEGGVRTPFMLRWRGRIEPRRYETLVSSIDVAPTVLAACGLQATREMTGINLLAACSGKTIQRETIFGENFAHDIADLDRPSSSILYRWCIQKHWKLILTEKGKVGRYQAVQRRHSRGPQLFDLQKDPLEKRNLATEHPEVVGRLRDAIDAWWKPAQRL